MRPTNESQVMDAIADGTLERELSAKDAVLCWACYAQNIERGRCTFFTFTKLVVCQ